MRERIGGREDFLELVREYGSLNWLAGTKRSEPERPGIDSEADALLAKIGDKLDELVALAKQLIADARLTTREKCARVADSSLNDIGGTIARRIRELEP